MQCSARVRPPEAPPGAGLASSQGGGLQPSTPALRLRGHGRGCRRAGGAGRAGPGGAGSKVAAVRHRGAAAWSAAVSAAAAASSAPACPRRRRRTGARGCAGRAARRRPAGVSASTRAAAAHFAASLIGRAEAQRGPAVASPPAPRRGPCRRGRGAAAAPSGARAMHQHEHGLGVPCRAGRPPGSASTFTTGSRPSRSLRAAASRRWQPPRGGRRRTRARRPAGARAP